MHLLMFKMSSSRCFQIVLETEHNSEHQTWEVARPFGAGPKPAGYRRKQTSQNAV